MCDRKTPSVFICKHHKQDVALQDYAHLFIHPKLVVCYYFAHFIQLWLEKRRCFSSISFQFRELAIIYAYSRGRWSIKKMNLVRLVNSWPIFL
jgi:hypothetical protein